MALRKVIKKKHATVVVEARGELLFRPRGDVAKWKNRFSQKLQIAAAAAAPVNKRPRWSHYGKALKSTMNRSETRLIENPAGASLHSAVGSSSPYAYYVDQGTGTYNNGSPYLATLLPPWGERYNYRDKALGGKDRGGIVVQGQKGQEYFDEALRATFGAMLITGRKRPLASVGALAVDAVSPDFLLRGAGNTPSTAAFKEQRKRWLRDERARRREFMAARRETRPAKTVKPSRTTPKASVEKAKSRQKPTRQGPVRPDKSTAFLNARTRVAKGLKERGLVVSSLNIAADGTFTAIVSDGLGKPTRRIKGRW